MTHLEDYNSFHAKVFLNKVHAFGALRILESICIIAVESIHDVPLKVLQEIHLGLEVFRVLRYGIALADVHCTVAS